MTAQSPPRPLVIAHRGASFDLPENTLPAIARAREVGADRIEVDVHRTRDGVVVVHHDEDLARAAGIPRRIADSTLAELERIPLAKLAAGQVGAAPTIPTLRAALASAGPVPLVVELKEIAGASGESVAEFVRAVLADVDAAGAAACTSLISFSDAIVAAALPALGPDRVGAIRGSDNGPHAWRDLERSPTSLVVVSRKIATPDVVTRIARAGKRVFVYALDDADSVRAYAAAGAAGIISNRPDVALAALRG